MNKLDKLLRDGGLEEFLLQRWDEESRRFVGGSWKPAKKEVFSAKLKIEGKTVHIGDFPTYLEASLAKAAAATLWNIIGPHLTMNASWKQETKP